MLKVCHRWTSAQDISRWSSIQINSHNLPPTSVIFVNENENENGEKWENNEFVNEN